MLRRRAPAVVLLGALPLLVAPSCGERDDTASLAPFVCQLGLPGEGGAFVPLVDGARVELQLGFQGFLLVELLARTDEGDVGPVVGAVSLTPQDLAPLGSSGMRLGFVDGVTPPIQVFLDVSDLGAYVGRPAHVALRLTGARAQCVVEGDLLLVDDDPCIHTGDEPICPGDTGDSG